MTLDEIKAAIAALEREDRATLRPWILARFDVQGYAVPIYQTESDTGPNRPASPKQEPRP